MALFPTRKSVCVVDLLYSSKSREEEDALYELYFDEDADEDESIDTSSEEGEGQSDADALPERGRSRFSQTFQPSHKPCTEESCPRRISRTIDKEDEVKAVVEPGRAHDSTQPQGE